MKFYIILASTILLFGSSVFFRKLAVDRMHPYQIQIIATMIYVVSAPIWFYLASKQNFSWLNAPGIVYTVICILMYILAAVLFSFLLKSTSEPGMVATLVAMNPVITSLLSLMFLNEEFSTKKIIATVIMLFGFYLFN